MASVHRESSHMSLPGLKSDTRSEGGESLYKLERPSSIPIPIPGGRTSMTAPTKPSSAPVNPPPANPPPANQPPVNPRPKSTGSPVHHRFLTPAEWARVAHGIGAIRDGETHSVIHPTCWYWPPKGMPDGLYRDVIKQRSKYLVAYGFLSTFRWILMILQLTLGAILTALGSVKVSNVGVVITVLAAVNTIDAGLLALLHNSGLPDRYRLNKVEFIKCEDYLKEILDTGIIEAGQSVDDVLSQCFQRFQNAKATVLANMPDAYTIQPTLANRSTLICPDPNLHFNGTREVFDGRPTPAA